MKPRRTQQPEETSLPQVPDYPDSPLSAWKHYGIMKLAQQKTHEYLRNVPYDGHLIGLRISYSAGTEPSLQDTYTMSYGYDVDEEQDLMPDTDEPFSDDFIIELYKYANQLIAENINPYITSFQTNLDASVNPRRRRIRIEPRICAAGECANNPSTCVGNLRLMVKRNKKPWVCQHIDPNDL